MKNTKMSSTQAIRGQLIPTQYKTDFLVVSARVVLCLLITIMSLTVPINANATNSSATMANSTVNTNTITLPYGKNISQQCAANAMNAAFKYAQSKQWKVTIAVVDSAGQIMMLNRMDNAHRATPEFAIAKASSAVRTKRSTKIFSDALSKGRTAILGFMDLHVHAAEGGEVIVHKSSIIGGIGVAGVTQQQDREVALIGANAINACS